MNSGIYHVVVSNAVGSTLSDIATLVYNLGGSQPVITAQPAAQTVATSSTVTFSAVASGSPAPAYQWRKNGVNISGATSASFRIINVSATHAGNYTVVATNSAGSVTSSTALLTVTAPLSLPVFIAQPAKQTVVANTAVTFTAAVNSAVASTYQWKKDGVNISGATSATLKIGSATAASAGTYTVVATTAAGAVTSSGALLTVTAAESAPVFTTQPAKQSVTEKTTVTFTAAASGSPTPAYQWRKEGVAIGGATAATYTMTNVALASAGTYTVVATNSKGSVTSTAAVLTVTAAVSVPVFTTQPASQPAVIGGVATFTAAATGLPTPTYQWQKDGVNVRGATSPTYTISNLLPEHAGTYSLVATNSAGSKTSTGASLVWPASVSLLKIDFNADGKDDIIWQNIQTGDCLIWLMNGTSAASVINLGKFSVDERVGGTGDFNGDRKPDIIWQNTKTSDCTIWLMNGTAVASKQVVAKEATNWQISRAGDFNRDGKADILWQNVVTGENMVSLLFDGRRSNIVFATQPLAWQVSGVGDFNSDGKTDIVWQNTVTGEASVWLMNDAVVTTQISLGKIGVEWQISGAGDYNSDKKSDLFWQNVLTGECSVWLMNGTAVTSKVALRSQSINQIMRN